MTFVNYQNSNNASSKLLADISASTTIILITSWEEALFPNSYPFLLTIEKVNSDWNVILREIVKVVSWNQNSFVVVRWAWKCVQDDTATTRVQSTATHSFSAWDRISLYWTAEQVKDIQDDLNSKLSIEEYQSWNYVYWASTTWNDDYAITLPIAPTSYAIWQVYRFLAWTENIWPATLNVNGLWAVAIKKNHDVALDTWDIEAWQIVEVAYDWTNFQMNSQTATIVDMKWINSTAFTWKAWQELHEWDVVQVASKYFDWSVATTSNAFWWASWLKWWIWFTSNWESIQNLQIKASIIDWTTPTAINVNLETDNNGSPSWTSLWSVDILNSLYANTNISSVSETYTSTHYWSTSVVWFYIWWWNLWKTRCFYTMSTSTWWYYASDWIFPFHRCIINSDWSSASNIWYDIIISWLLSTLWLSWTHTYTILYIDQDFKFMFLYENSTDKIYKLWFQAQPNGWSIRWFEVLWSRSKSIVWITSLFYFYTQLAFSDDWMFVYTMNVANSSSTWIVKWYKLSKPYDLTWATEIWDSWSVWTYTVWPCYMSLWNWKKYIVAWYTNNRYIKARELNSDWTISSTEKTLRSWPNDGWYQYWLSIWNYANWWASVCLNYNTSSTYRSYFETLWNEAKTTPSLIDFSFSSPIHTTSWSKYWITIAPTWWSVVNFMNLYSYEWDEWTSLSNYTDSWSLISNRSPYLWWDWINASCIVKQFESNIPFWNYWIADNNYEALSQAKFVNMWNCEHFTSLSIWRKYYMNNWKLNLDSWQYIWTAINERTLEIWKAIDESSKLQNVVATPDISSARSYSNRYWEFTAKSDWYYTVIWTSWGETIMFFVNWAWRAEKWWPLVILSTYMKKWDVWSFSTIWSNKTFTSMIVLWPDWSI